MKKKKIEKKRKINPFRKKKNRYEKKKTCDNKTQNSYDIKTNQTHLKKKTKPLFSLKNPLGKNTVEKNKKKNKENHSLKNTSL